MLAPLYVLLMKWLPGLWFCFHWCRIVLTSYCMLVGCSWG